MYKCAACTRARPELARSLCQGMPVLVRASTSASCKYVPVQECACTHVFLHKCTACTGAWPASVPVLVRACTSASCQCVPVEVWACTSARLYKCVACRCTCQCAWSKAWAQLGTLYCRLAVQVESLHGQLIALKCSKPLSRQGYSHAKVPDTGRYCVELAVPHVPLPASPCRCSGTTTDSTSTWWGPAPSTSPP